jgi:hypothetical protein
MELVKVMSDSALATLKRNFESLQDPRHQNSIDHLLIDIVTLTICTLICGADRWLDVQNYGLAKQESLQTFLALPNGIPSRDTIERLFTRLRPEQLQQCFLNWIQEAFEISGGQLIAVDGKTLRVSYERGRRKGMIHRVSPGPRKIGWYWGNGKWTRNRMKLPPFPNYSKS